MQSITNYVAQIRKLNANIHSISLKLGCQNSSLNCWIVSTGQYLYVHKVMVLITHKACGVHHPQCPICPADPSTAPGVLDLRPGLSPKQSAVEQSERPRLGRAILSHVRAPANPYTGRTSENRAMQF